MGLEDIIACGQRPGAWVRVDLGIMSMSPWAVAESLGPPSYGLFWALQ